MTGIPHFNFPSFINAAHELRALGHEVVNPVELDNPEDVAAAMASVDGSPIHYESGKTWGDFLARDVKVIADGALDGVMVLDGWATSRGARLETFVASALHGIPIYCLQCFYVIGEDGQIGHARLAAAWADDPFPVGVHG